MKFVIRCLIFQMTELNPFILVIFNILKNNNKTLSLYGLIKILEKSGYELIEKDINESNDLILFRKNFIVMNALYQLKIDLLDSDFELTISSLKIMLLTKSLDKGLGLPTESTDDILTAEALSEYYLNWDHYHLTNEQGVKELLDGFWDRFIDYNQGQNRYDKRLDSFQVLGLKSSASWKDIQQTYRQLITVYHPDKGGNGLKFIKIREAYLILKLTRSKSQ